MLQAARTVGLVFSYEKDATHASNMTLIATWANNLPDSFLFGGKWIQGQKMILTAMYIANKCNTEVKNNTTLPEPWNLFQKLCSNFSSHKEAENIINNIKFLKRPSQIH